MLTKSFVARCLQSAVSKLARIQQPRRARSRKSFGPVDAEQLESRVLMTATSIQVNANWDGHDRSPGNGVADASSSPGNQVTLRAAVEEANSLPGHQIVELPSGTFHLSLTDFSGGDIDIKDRLTIRGAGAESTVIDANGLNRIFEVHPGVTVEIEGVTLRDGQEQQGGAIKNRGRLTVRNSLFVNNTAHAGSGISNEESGELTVIGSTFSENHGTFAAVYSRANVAIQDSSFLDNPGGAVFARKESLDYQTFKITNSTFTGNTVSGTNKGVINLGKGIAAEIRDSDITENEGGAVYNQANLLIVGTNISDNDAYWTGGVNNVGQVSFMGSTLTNNTGVQGAGAASNSAVGQMSFHDSTVVGNDSTYSAGGLSTFGDVVITGTTFAHNKHGAIWVGSRYMNPAVLDIRHSLFRHNTAEAGAAINSWNGDLLLKDVGFDSNSAKSGGAIANSGLLEIALSVFENNTATDSGGAIDNHKNGQLVIQESQFSENSAKTGGAISNAGTVSIQNALIDHNSAELHGGAVFNQFGNVTLTDTWIQQNTAQNGAGVYSNQGTVASTLGVFDQNAASQSGGAIWSSGRFDDTSSTIYRNSAKQGGAIYSSGVTMLIGSVIFKNTATNGAGIYNTDKLVGVGIFLEANSASSMGGGIYNTGTTVIFNSHVRSNTAFIGGGMLNARNAELFVVNTEVVNNSAYYGGGIFNWNGVVWLAQGSVVNGNMAKVGREYYQNQGVTLIQHATIGDQLFANNWRFGFLSVN